jgi:hypothetical protein
MKTAIVLALLLCAATAAFADEYIENWPDPLGGWRDRYVAQYTNMQNYYVCSGGSDENERGNNPCGLWICDGTVDLTCTINFEPSFGATITLLEMGLQAFVDATLNVYDPANNLVSSTVLTVNYNSPYGCNCTLHTIDTPNGVSRFEIVPNAGSQIEGNMAIDDMRVVTGGNTPTQVTTWGSVKAMYR